MSPSMTGADVAELRRLAARFTQAAHDLQAMSTRLTASINGTQAWQGGDAAQFRATWNGRHRSLLEASRTALTDGAKVLVANADEQERASGGGTGSLAAGPGEGPGSQDGPDGEGGEDAPPWESLQKLFEDGTQAPWREGLANVLRISRLAPIIAGLSMSDEEYLAKAIAGSKWFSADEGLGNLIKTLGGDNWGELVDGLSSKLGALGTEGRFASLSEGLGSVGKVIGPIGKALGPIGVGFTGLAAINDFRTGHSVRGGFDTVATGLGAAALMTPPPADAICAAGAGAIVLGELVYDHWDGITHVGGEVVHGIENAGSSVVHGAEDLGSGIAHVAEDAWPF